jgi:hypothetical protein
MHVSDDGVDDIDATFQVDELDADITDQEVMDTMFRMANSKSGGPDGLIIEMFKHSSDHIVPHLTTLFNVILHDGIFQRIGANQLSALCSRKVTGQCQTITEVLLC